MAFVNIQQLAANIDSSVIVPNATPGNTTVDSSAAFNQAISDGFARNLPVFIRPGTYRLNNPLIIPGSVTFQSLTGEQNCVFLCGGITGSILKSFNPLSTFTGCRFRGFRFDGEASTTITAGMDICGMGSTIIEDVRVQNISTVGVFGFRADNSIGFSNSLIIRDCTANNLTNGRGFHINSAGTVGQRLYGQFNRESFVFNGTESNYTDLLTSDNAGSTIGSALTMQNSNRTNVTNFVSGDSSTISVLLNGATNCNLSNFELDDNNQAITGGANGGLLYMAGCQNCNVSNVDIEILFATPVAGTFLVNWDNGSSGANINNHLTNIRANGHTRANTRGLRVPSATLGVDNKFVNFDVSLNATNDTLLETQGRFGIVNANGIVATNTGTAQINAAGTSVVVNHGLNYTPQRVYVTPTSDAGIATRHWVSTRTTTQFTINCSPATTNALTFDWKAIAYEEQ